MKLGIIGADAAKFNQQTQAQAEIEILDIIEHFQYMYGVLPTIVSGRCHLGGIDVWAEEIAHEKEAPTLIFPPKHHRWEPEGYKQRNIQIAEQSNIIYVIVLKELPFGYRGLRFNGCYHCDRRRLHKQKPHVKSGACWTAWYAIEKLNKPAKWIII